MEIEEESTDQRIEILIAQLKELKCDAEAVTKLTEVWNVFKNCIENNKIRNLHQCFHSLLRYTALVLYDENYEKKVDQPTKSSLTCCVQSVVDGPSLQEFPSLKNVCSSLVPLTKEPWSCSTIKNVLFAKDIKSLNEDAICKLWSSEGWLFLDARMQLMGKSKNKSAREMVARILYTCVIKGKEMWTDSSADDVHYNLFDPYRYSLEQYLEFLEVYVLFWHKEIVEIDFLTTIPPGIITQLIEGLRKKAAAEHTGRLVPKMWKTNLTKVYSRLARKIIPFVLKRDYVAANVKKLLDLWIAINLEATVGAEQFEKIQESVKAVLVESGEVFRSDYLYSLSEVLLDRLQSSEKIREFFLEVYLKAVFIDMNLINKLRAETPMNTEKLRIENLRLSNRYLQLSAFFKDYPLTSRGLCLTAFSLNPCEELFNNLFPSASQNPLTEANDIDVDMLEYAAPPHKSIVSSEEDKQDTTETTTTSSQTIEEDVNKELEIEDLKLPSCLSDDLDSAITTPRWSALGHFTKGEELKKLCSQLLAAGSEYLIKDKPLDFVNVDFELYSHLPSKYDPNDDGIEKGFGIHDRKKGKRTINGRTFTSKKNSFVGRGRPIGWRKGVTLGKKDLSGKNFIRNGKNGRPITKKPLGVKGKVVKTSVHRKNGLKALPGPEKQSGRIYQAEEMKQKLTNFSTYVRQNQSLRDYLSKQCKNVKLCQLAKSKKVREAYKAKYLNEKINLPGEFELIPYPRAYKQPTDVTCTTVETQRPQPTGYVCPVTPCRLRVAGVGEFHVEFRFNREVLSKKFLEGLKKDDEKGSVPNTSNNITGFEFIKQTVESSYPTTTNNDWATTIQELNKNLEINGTPGVGQPLPVQVSMNLNGVKLKSDDSSFHGSYELTGLTKKYNDLKEEARRSKLRNVSSETVEIDSKRRVKKSIAINESSVKSMTPTNSGESEFPQEDTNSEADNLMEYAIGEIWEFEIVTKKIQLPPGPKSIQEEMKRKIMVEDAIKRLQNNLKLETYAWDTVQNQYAALKAELASSSNSNLQSQSDPVQVPKPRVFGPLTEKEQLKADLEGTQTELYKDGLLTERVFNLESQPSTSVSLDRCQITGEVAIPVHGQITAFAQTASTKTAGGGQMGREFPFPRTPAKNRKGRGSVGFNMTENMQSVVTAPSICDAKDNLPQDLFQLSQYGSDAASNSEKEFDRTYSRSDDGSLDGIISSPSEYSSCSETPGREESDKLKRRKIHSSRIPEETVAKIRADLYSGFQVISTAKKFNVSSSWIYNHFKMGDLPNRPIRGRRSNSQSATSPKKQSTENKAITEHEKPVDNDKSREERNITTGEGTSTSTEGTEVVVSMDVLETNNELIQKNNLEANNVEAVAPKDLETNKVEIKTAEEKKKNSVVLSLPFINSSFIKKAGELVVGKSIDIPNPLKAKAKDANEADGIKKTENTVPEISKKDGNKGADIIKQNGHDEAEITKRDGNEGPEIIIKDGNKISNEDSGGFLGSNKNMQEAASEGRIVAVDREGLKENESSQASMVRKNEDTSKANLSHIAIVLEKEVATEATVTEETVVLEKEISQEALVNEKEEATKGNVTQEAVVPEKEVATRVNASSESIGLINKEATKVNDKSQECTVTDKEKNTKENAVSQEFILADNKEDTDTVKNGDVSIGIMANTSQKPKAVDVVAKHKLDDQKLRYKCCVGIDRIDFVKQPKRVQDQMKSCEENPNQIKTKRSSRLQDKVKTSGTRLSFKNGIIEKVPVENNVHQPLIDSAENNTTQEVPNKKRKITPDVVKPLDVDSAALDGQKDLIKATTLKEKENLLPEKITKNSEVQEKQDKDVTSIESDSNCLKPVEIKLGTVRKLNSVARKRTAQRAGIKNRQAARPVKKPKKKKNNRRILHDQSSGSSDDDDESESRSDSEYVPDSDLTDGSDCDFEGDVVPVDKNDEILIQKANNVHKSVSPTSLSVPSICLPVSITPNPKDVCNQIVNVQPKNGNRISNGDKSVKRKASSLSTHQPGTPKKVSRACPTKDPLANDPPKPKDPEIIEITDDSETDHESEIPQRDRRFNCGPPVISMDPEYLNNCNLISNIPTPLSEYQVSGSEDLMNMPQSFEYYNNSHIGMQTQFFSRPHPLEFNVTHPSSGNDSYLNINSASICDVLQTNVGGGNEEEEFILGLSHTSISDDELTSQGLCDSSNPAVFSNAETVFNHSIGENVSEPILFQTNMQTDIESNNHNVQTHSDTSVGEEVTMEIDDDVDVMEARPRITNSTNEKELEDDVREVVSIEMDVKGDVREAGTNIEDIMEAAPLVNDKTGDSNVEEDVRKECTIIENFTEVTPQIIIITKDKDVEDDVSVREEQESTFVEGVMEVIPQCIDDTKDRDVEDNNVKETTIEKDRFVEDIMAEMEIMHQVTDEAKDRDMEDHVKKITKEDDVVEEVINVVPLFTEKAKDQDVEYNVTKDIPIENGPIVEDVVSCITEKGHDQDEENMMEEITLENRLLVEDVIEAMPRITDKTEDHNTANDVGEECKMGSDTVEEDSTGVVLSLTDKTNYRDVENDTNPMPTFTLSNSACKDSLCISSLDQTRIKIRDKDESPNPGSSSCVLIDVDIEDPDIPILHREDSPRRSNYVDSEEDDNSSGCPPPTLLKYA